MRALRGVDFAIYPGEVQALVGENGAGKSTLIKILTGAVTPDEGAIFVSGRRCGSLSVAEAKSAGIAAIYQQPSLFPELSVAENLALHLHASQSGVIGWQKRRSRAAELLARVGANISPDRLAESLSLPEQQLVEIAKALGADARVLIMDEPTASLSEADGKRLFALIRGLRAQGRGIVYISHRLEELPLIADRVTVLRDGEWIASQPIEEMDRPALIRAMAGREVSQVFPKRHAQPGDIALESDGILVRRGEILGIAGLVGSGRTEWAQRIFFAHRDGIVAYVPEDRRRHGVIGAMTVAENVTLASLQRLRLDFAGEQSLAEEYRGRLEIKAASVDVAVDTLSGGNAQKVALARWLATSPKVLLLDEPTQGVDVGAKAEIHRLMSDLATQGMAIVMISSELPEILGMSDRIAVMREGRIVATINREDASQDRILSLMLGVAA